MIQRRPQTSAALLAVTSIRESSSPRTGDRPSLGALQNLANEYFTKPPVVKWKQMTDRSGEAHLEGRKIFLDPNNPGGLGCDIGPGLAYRPRVEFNPPLSSREKYYLTLLHEIAHFKIRNVMPKWVRKTIHKLRADILEGAPPLPERVLRERMFDEVFGELPRVKGEKVDEYQGRIEIVRHWIFGVDIVGHKEVEDWAVKEFRRLRRSLEAALVERRGACP